MSKKKREDQMTKIKLIIEWYEQLCSNKLDNLDEMYTLLETQNLSRLNYEELEDLHRPVISKDIEFVIKIFQQKVLDLLVLLEFLANILKKLISIHLKHFQKLKRRKHSLTQSMRPALPWYQSQSKTLPPLQKHPKTAEQYSL